MQLTGSVTSPVSRTSPVTTCSTHLLPPAMPRLPALKNKAIIRQAMSLVAPSPRVTAQARGKAAAELMELSREMQHEREEDDGPSGLQILAKSAIHPSSSLSLSLLSLPRTSLSPLPAIPDIPLGTCLAKLSRAMQHEQEEDDGPSGQEKSSLLSPPRTSLSFLPAISDIPLACLVKPPYH